MKIKNDKNGTSLLLTDKISAILYSLNTLFIYKKSAKILNYPIIKFYSFGRFFRLYMIYYKKSR